MEAIRTKDKIFIATVVPLALALAYVFLWRTDAVKKVDGLRTECASLVAVEDFDFERMGAERRLKAAEETLAAQKAMPIPPAKVKADAGASVAARELAIIETFRKAGLVVTASRASPSENAANREALRATGVLPSPVLRVYEVDGSFCHIVAALRAIDCREMAAVPDGVAMCDLCKWRISLWL